MGAVCLRLLLLLSLVVWAQLRIDTPCCDIKLHVIALLILITIVLGRPEILLYIHMNFGV